MCLHVCCHAIAMNGSVCLQARSTGHWWTSETLSYFLTNRRFRVEPGILNNQYSTNPDMSNGLRFGKRLRNPKCKAMDIQTTYITLLLPDCTQTLYICNMKVVLGVCPSLTAASFAWTRPAIGQPLVRTSWLSNRLPTGKGLNNNKESKFGSMVSQEVGTACLLQACC